MLQGDLKWGAFHASDAFVLPSHQENFGIAVAEALGCGLPALISDKVNIWREVEADGAGFVAHGYVEGTPGICPLAATRRRSARRRCARRRSHCSSGTSRSMRCRADLLRVLAAGPLANRRRTATLASAGLGLN